MWRIFSLFTSQSLTYKHVQLQRVKQHKTIAWASSKLHCSPLLLVKFEMGIFIPDLLKDPINHTIWLGYLDLLGFTQEEQVSLTQQVSNPNPQKGMAWLYRFMRLLSVKWYAGLVMVSMVFVYTGVYYHNLPASMYTQKTSVTVHKVNYTMGSQVKQWVWNGKPVWVYKRYSSLVSNYLYTNVTIVAREKAVWVQLIDPSTGESVAKMLQVGEMLMIRGDVNYFVTISDGSHVQLLLKGQRYNVNWPAKTVFTFTVQSVQSKTVQSHLSLV